MDIYYLKELMLLIVFSLSVVKFSVQLIAENLFDFVQGKCFLF